MFDMPKSTSISLTTDDAHAGTKRKILDEASSHKMPETKKAKVLKEINSLPENKKPVEREGLDLSQEGFEICILSNDHMLTLNIGNCM